MIEGFYLSNWPMGWLYGWRVGLQLGPLRPCPNPEEILQEFAPMFGEEPEKLDGLTLFHTTRGWQLSTREKDQPGWSVRIIPNDQAFTILSAMEKRGYPITLDQLESVQQFGVAKDPITRAQGRTRQDIEAEITAAKQPEPAVTINRSMTLLETLATAEKGRSALTDLILTRL